MTKNEFIQAIAIAAAHGTGAAVGMGGLRGLEVVDFARTIAENFAARGFFKDTEKDPDELPSPDPKLLSALDALRNANRTATDQISALREENAALRQQLDAEEKKYAEAKADLRVTLRRLAAVLSMSGGRVVVTTDRLRKLDASDWTVSIDESTPNDSFTPTAFIVTLNMGQPR